MSSNNTTYNSTEREAVIAEMDKLLSLLEKQAKYLREVNKTLKKIDADCDTLEKYYFADWLDDYNHFHSDKHYMVLLQDPIHNVLQEIHEEKLKLLKRIAGKLR